MDATKLVLLILCTKCIAVNIRRMDVPPLVKMGVESITLDCEYGSNGVTQAGLVMKWFFNGPSGLVYQWIPPLRPQVIGLLKGKVDLDFRISDEPLQAYRAIKILKPTTDLSGNYTCVVSTFMEEDRQTKSMLVYNPGKQFEFSQEKKYVFLVTLKCSVEEVYPKPAMTILSRGKPIKSATSELKMDSWGLYTLTTTAEVHDDDVLSPWQEFVCELSIPLANYTETRTTVYYPGFVPTSYSVPVEVERLQRPANNANISTYASCFTTALFYISVSFIMQYMIINNDK